MATANDLRPRVDRARGCVEDEIGSARTAGSARTDVRAHEQSSLERNGGHRDDTMAAHRAVALVVHEQDAGMRSWGYRLGEERAVHIRVPARLEHQRTPQVIDVPPHPLAFFEHRLSAGSRQPVDNKAQRLASSMGVDRLDNMNHHLRT